MLKRFLLCTLLLFVALAGISQSITIDKIKYEVISPAEAVLVVTGGCLKLRIFQ